MLDAIADFWKPVKRLQAAARLKPEELQMGTHVTFSNVPQPSLSGRKMTVTGINTYKFGPDILTSFVLSQDKDAGASMIIAETGGEQYIAVSRRLSISDRNKLFAHEDIEAVITREDMHGIDCRDITPEYKGWLATHYKRELNGVKGHLYKGDHRTGLISGATALDFAYTLLVSDNNEHALEIEKYDDGRVEVYATVYRRMSDVNEVQHPGAKEISRPDVKLVSNGSTPSFTASAKPEPKLGENAPAASVPEKNVALEAKAPEVKTEARPNPIAWKAAPKPEEKPEAKIEAAPEPKVESKPELKKEPEVIAAEKKAAEVQANVTTSPVKLPEFSSADVAKKEVPVEAAPLAKIAVSTTSEPPASQASIVVQSNTQPYIKQEIKAVNKETSNFVNESIDCELQVANKIIDEAIRNEMRINDVVRRVIGLPVSQQESVQIPVTLTDQDYALLAIRYGISGSDHEAIKRRITEDLNDFSGANKQKKAA